MLTAEGETRTGRGAKILVAVDQVPGGETKIPVAIQYARLMGAQIVLLHVLPPHALDRSAVLPDESYARAYLDTVAGQILAAEVPAVTVVRSGVPAHAIVDEAEIIGASLIILGANVRSRLATAVGGSIADQVARTASCPVLLVQPDPDIQHKEPPTLRRFTEDAARRGPLRRRHLGVRPIEIARIIGSVCRAQQFGTDFRERDKHTKGTREGQRFERVLTAMESGMTLPPIVVFQLGFGYYVNDGHHRVVAAGLLGQTEIDADVTEFVSIGSEQSVGLFTERTHFEQLTGVVELGAARAESYPVLLRAIERFAAAEGLTELRLAGRRWERQVYRPLWQTIRSRELSAAFPGDRTADIVARAAELVEASGLSWEQALDAVICTPTPSGGPSTSEGLPANGGRT